QIPLSEACGLVLAQDIVAQEDIPPFANSAMDGFALLSRDSQPQHGQPPRLRITGEVAAGYVADHAVEEGTTMRIMTGAPLPPGKIRNSNSYRLEAAVRQAGAVPHRLGVAHDTVESLREKFTEAVRYNLIITSGGVSVGDFDLVKNIMAEQGQINFWRINMRPGKPVAFGHIGGVPLLGLPGNPVSAAVTFELFGRPVIRKMMGHTRLVRPQVDVIVDYG